MARIIFLGYATQATRASLVGVASEGFDVLRYFPA